MAISEKIQQIIRQRAKHLPKIRAMRAHLQKMLEKLDKLDSLVAVVNGEIAAEFNRHVIPKCLIMMV